VIGVSNRLRQDAIKRLSWPKKGEAAEQQSEFRVEAMEPRLLLSAEVLPAAALLLQDQSEPTTAIIEYQSSEQIVVSQDGWGEPSVEEQSEQSSLPANEDSTVSARSTSQQSEFVNSTVEIAPPFVDSNDATIDQLSEALRLPNGPPDASDTDADLTAVSPAQLIYLDADGAQDVTSGTRYDRRH
jgi:hypothetical protein